MAYLDCLLTCKASLKEAIMETAKPFEQECQLIQTAPACCSDPLTAVKILSEIGVDMTQFHSAKHMASWSGLAPTNNESGGKKKSSRISKAWQYLKPLHVQLANVIVKNEKYPEHRNKYLQLKKRRGHKKAIIAIARCLLTAIYYMLLKGEPYNPALYKQTEVRLGREGK